MRFIGLLTFLIASVACFWGEEYIAKIAVAFTMLIFLIAFIARTSLLTEAIDTKDQPQ